MVAETYAVVCYLPGFLGEFLTQLRARLDPEYARAVSHVTLLPPRELSGAAEEKLEELRHRCAAIEPFRVSIDGVSTFWPISGVVYLSFGEGQAELVSLHNAMNINCMKSPEPFEYTPHVTIVQDLNEQGTHRMLETVTSEWSRFQGESSFRIDSLVLVRQKSEHEWVDIGRVPLGSYSYQSRR